MTKDEIFKRAFDILKEESNYRWDDIIDYITEYNIDENLDDIYNNITVASEFCVIMSKDEAKAHLLSNAIMDKIQESVMQGNY